jgi:hypothetical protein
MVFTIVLIASLAVGTAPAAIILARQQQYLLGRQPDLGRVRRLERFKSIGWLVGLAGWIAHLVLAGFSGVHLVTLLAFGYLSYRYLLEETPLLQYCRNMERLQALRANLDRQHRISGDIRPGHLR